MEREKKNGNWVPWLLEALPAPAPASEPFPAVRLFGEQAQPPAMQQPRSHLQPPLQVPELISDARSRGQSQGLGRERCFPSLAAPWCGGILLGTQQEP